MGYRVGYGGGGGDDRVVDSNFGCGIVVLVVRVSGTCDGGDGEVGDDLSNYGILVVVVRLMIVPIVIVLLWWLCG